MSEHQKIYEGVVAVDNDTSKVFLVQKDSIIDINARLARFTGKKTKVVVAESENI